MNDIADAALGRFGGDTPLAFVLSGGANRGAIQAGALLAVIESGITPDLVAGTSVGALNAAWLAWRPDDARARALVEVWRGMCRSGICSGPPRGSV